MLCGLFADGYTITHNESETPLGYWLSLAGPDESLHHGSLWLCPAQLVTLQHLRSRVSRNLTHDCGDEAQASDPKNARDRLYTVDYGYLNKIAGPPHLTGSGRGVHQPMGHTAF
jgi:hypothetical protein